MADQLCLFEEVDYWIAEVDNGCRMWKCPGCTGRMVGPPLHWHQYNSYNYCPYCGLRLFTQAKYLIDGAQEEE